ESAEPAAEFARFDAQGPAAERSLSESRLRRSSRQRATRAMTAVGASVLGTRDHFAGARSAQRGEDCVVDRLADELHVSIGEQKVAPAGVKAVRLVVVAAVHRIGAAIGGGAALDAAVGAGQVKTEWAFAVGPADPLFIRQTRMLLP